jgi:hypothetical protein
MSLDLDDANLDCSSDTDTLSLAAPVVFLKSPQKRLDDVIVNVRFHKNGTVIAIDHKPENLSRQEWFYCLFRAAVANYQALMGGRGHFRIPFSKFESILAQNIQ